MTIPVRNVYYLLCYAWDRMRTPGVVDVDAVPNDRVENLLGKVLQEGVGQLIRQGLDRGYVPFEDEGRRLRGKLMMAESVKRTLIPRGRVACRVDELSYDVPHNRVLKAAMRALIGLPSLDRNIRSGLNALCGRLGEVTDIDLTPSVFRRVQLHRNIARYSFLVNVAELVARSFVPDERTGKRRFRPFTASEQEMGLLFEGFVRNFLRREQDHFHVSARKIPWDIDVETSSDPAWMPEMRTDVMLSHTETRIALEAKYYASPYQRRHGTKKLISAHLYQLLTYLSQLRAIDGPDPMGVLLYAGAGEQQRLDYRIGDQPVLVRSLDLNREWREIHRDLLSIAEELKESR